MQNKPDRLGKYEITEVLGEGAMGVVYKGFDPDIRREVAIKTIRGALDDDGAVTRADRFRNEARAAGRLQHPGIVGVYDFGRDGDTAFIAMEFVQGQPLSRYIAQSAAGQLPIGDDDILSISGQLLEALHHAHEQGVWHRDVKPANLIMTRAGKLKIADFGIARIEASGLTMATSMIGTPMYMAPEQFQGKAIDRRVDIYSAGVVLYQLVTGRTPFSGTPEMLMYKAVHEMPVLPSQLPGIERSDAYDAVLARAMAKSPTERFPTALAFRDALIGAVGRAINDRVSEATIVGLKLPPRRAEVGPPSQHPGSGSGSSLTPGAFDRAQLAQAEATLARVIGPMASVMVKRAARECPDLPALYARLAEHVTDPAARKVFIHHATQATGGTGGTGGGTFGGGAGTTGGGSLATVTALSPALLEAAQRLLALQVGPIAKLLVKKAAAAAPRRAAFIDQLAQTLSDPVARQKFIDELHRLG